MALASSEAALKNLTGMPPAPILLNAFSSTCSSLSVVAFLIGLNSLAVIVLHSKDLSRAGEYKEKHTFGKYPFGTRLNCLLNESQHSSDPVRY